MHAAAAHAKFVRFTSRKVNQVLTLIRNKPVEKAFEILSFTPKAPVTLIAKTLKSAVANGGGLKTPKSLKVKEAWVGQGPVLKRMRPGPQGRGMPYKRKTCHLTIVVSEMSADEIKKLTRKKKNRRRQKPVAAKPEK
jgi:ribosomal protein L22, bacterial type